MKKLDARSLRDAFGAFITGVTVVTSVDEHGEPIGFTANSFTSVSLDPPLLLVCIDKASQNIHRFRDASGFAVNVLSEGQREVSQTFARPIANRFAAVTWTPGPHGSPVFDGVSAWFDCATHETVDAGDHIILIGRVMGFDNAGRNGLGYIRGSYFAPSAPEQALAAAATEGPVMIGAVVERDGQVLLLDVPGGLAIPTSRIDTRGKDSSQLARLLADLGLPPSPGFVYSVYHDRGSDSQHIVYRCTVDTGMPNSGGFYSLDEQTLSRILIRGVRNMLRRFADESRVGNFGVYFGHERSGEVRRSSTS